MRIGRLFFVWPAVLAVYLACGIDLVGQEDHSAEDISTCDTIVVSSPRGYGISYKGTIRNDDYRFTVIIPTGFTGWGAGAGAPFHGFIIYLDDDNTESCIDFDVAIRVILPEDRALNRGRSAKSSTQISETKVRVNGKTGIETVSRGLSHGTSIDNVYATFKIPDSFIAEGRPVRDTIGVAVGLLTPTKDREKTEPIFRQFLSQLKFY